MDYAMNFMERRQPIALILTAGPQREL